MNPAYAKKLDILIRKTDVGAQKIDGSHLDTFGMGHGRLFTPGQAGKGLILPGDFSSPSAVQTYGLQRGSSFGGLT